MDLLESRQKIDEIDKEIVRLVEERMKVSVKVAEYKNAHAKKVYDREREKQILDKLGKMCENQFMKQSITELYTQIMSISRKLQYKMLHERKNMHKFELLDSLDLSGKKVVYYGEQGAYTEQAMFEYFNHYENTFSVRTFRDVMEAVQNEEAEYGVLPVENSSTGGILDVYNLLLEYDTSIVGVHEIKIEQCLLGLPDAEIEEIRKVYSHQQGILQCSKFLEEHAYMQPVTYMSTALSAKRIREEGNKEHAAIASRRAAECYGLKVLQADINEEQTNTTRFIIITKGKKYICGADKVNICIQLPHECGSLYNILSHFIFNNLNMTKIESRPIQGMKWEYRFFIEFEGKLSDPGVQNALNGIEEEAGTLKILGNYA